MATNPSQRTVARWGGFLGLVLAMGVGACTGLIGDGGPASGAVAGGDAGTGGDSDVNLPPNPGASPLRRLTNAEYNNTVADLLGDTTAPANAFPGETTSVLGYDTYASGLGVSLTHVQAYLTAAEALATNAVANLPALLACDVSAHGEQACTQQFLSSFGQRAFRRPLTAAELSAWQQFEGTARSTVAFADAIRITLEAFLLSPAFLYRVEYGQPGNAGDFVKLTSWETASRLSYTFVGSMPDAELFRAAGNDELLDPANIEKQARRLLLDPRAQQTFTRFVDQWLELRAILGMQKDGAAFPTWNDSLKPLMKEEANRVVDSVVWQGNGDVHGLFSASYTFVNGPLATFYGIPGVTGSDFVRVNLDPASREGILSLPGVLAAHGKANETVPPQRGKFVRTKVFCLPQADPPANAQAMAPAVMPGMTARQLFTLIEQNPTCGSCHQGLDGVGFGLENFDAVGLSRTVDNGGPVDNSGKLLGTDVDGPFAGGVELANKVAASDEVPACAALQFFRFATGRPEAEADKHSIAVLTTAFHAAGYNVQELLVALTRTDAFLLRPSLGATP